MALTNFFGSDPFSLTGPTLLGSFESLVSSVSGAPVVTGTTLTTAAQVTTAFGPTSILISDPFADRSTFAGCVSSMIGSVCPPLVPFQVLAGTLNINTNADVQFDIFRTITTTDTFNTLASYEIVGMLGSGGGIISPIPEPSTFALLTFGLALAGWRARRRLQ